MAGNAAQAKPVVHARRYAEPIRHLNGSEGDVVGVFQHSDRAAAVEGDIELAWQPVKFTMVQDEMMDRPRMRPCVDQFLPVDPGRWAAGDIAHIVRARSPCRQPEVGQSGDDLRRRSRRDFAQLQIGARGDVRIAAGMLVRQIGQPAHLPGMQDATGNAQAAHEAVLRGRDIEQTVELRQEYIGALGKLPFRGQGRDLIEPIQRVLLSLAFFLGRQLAAGGDDAVLRQTLQVVRIGHSSRDGGQWQA